MNKKFLIQFINLFNKKKYCTISFLFLKNLINIHDSNTISNWFSKLPMRRQYMFVKRKDGKRTKLKEGKSDHWKGGKFKD